MNYTRFANARVAASSVAALLGDKKRKLTLRPWNQYKPDQTTWWIVPGTAWPAYHHGKFAFVLVGDMLSCGLYVEKGLGASTLGMYSSNLVMDSDWQWNQFIRDVESGRVMEVATNVRLPLYLSLSADIVRGGFDPMAPKPDQLVFRIAEGVLIKTQEQLDMGCLTPLAKLESLERLPALLSEMQNLDWLWIDLVLGTQLLRPTEGADLSGAVDGWNLVQDLFEYLEPWFI